MKYQTFDETVMVTAVQPAPTRAGLARWAITATCLDGDRSVEVLLHTFHEHIAAEAVRCGRAEALARVHGYIRPYSGATFFTITYLEPADAAQAFGLTTDDEAWVRTTLDQHVRCRIPGCGGRVAPLKPSYASTTAEAIARLRVEEQLCHDHARRLHAAGKQVATA